MSSSMLLRIRESGRQSVGAAVGVITFTVLLLAQIGTAEAVPAFARKYQANCALCHDNEPRLAPFGQQFKENGYQMPGSSDGGTMAKTKLEGEQGPVTLDQISNIMAVRIRADIQQVSFEQETDAMKEAGVTEGVDFETPRIVNVFVAGTAREDLSYYLEIESNTNESPDPSLKFERAFLQFSNLGGRQSLANVQVGRFDPSALFAFPTHRQQLNPVGPDATTDTDPPEVNRIPLLPMAFSSKMFGLTRGDGFGPSMGGAMSGGADEGFAILPFEPFLYNAPSQKGIAIYGRPGGYGSGFMYQVGMAVNDKVTGDATRENRYDAYVMGRYDWMTGGGKNLQVSGFYYKAPEAAIATLNMGGTIYYADNATDIERTGVGARAQWGPWDIYGAYIMDRIDAPGWNDAVLAGGVAAPNSAWETDAAGLSLEADWRMHDNWMLGVRYDQMSPGGLERLPAGSSEPLNVDAAFIAPIVKYYPSPNIGLYARAHVNLESDKKTPIGGGTDEHPATNLTSLLSFGVDMAF